MDGVAITSDIIRWMSDDFSVDKTEGNSLAVDGKKDRPIAPEKAGLIKEAMDEVWGVYDGVKKVRGKNNDFLQAIEGKFHGVRGAADVSSREAEARNITRAYEEPSKAVSSEIAKFKGFLEKVYVPGDVRGQIEQVLKNIASLDTEAAKQQVEIATNWFESLVGKSEEIIGDVSQNRDGLVQKIGGLVGARGESEVVSNFNGRVRQLQSTASDESRIVQSVESTEKQRNGERKKKFVELVNRLATPNTKSTGDQI